MPCATSSSGTNIQTGEEVAIKLVRRLARKLQLSWLFDPTEQGCVTDIVPSKKSSSCACRGGRAYVAVLSSPHVGVDQDSAPTAAL